MPAKEPELLTIAELAARWRVPERAAKEVVRVRRVPFVSLTPGDLRMVWDRVRFDLDAVRQWERESRTAYESPGDQATKSGRAGAEKRLGDWRA